MVGAKHSGARRNKLNWVLECFALAVRRKPSQSRRKFSCAAFRAKHSGQQLIFERGIRRMLRPYDYVIACS
jgi:hypothetical protein